MILKLTLGSDFLSPLCWITLFETQNSIITNILNSPHPNMVPFLLISMLVMLKLCCFNTVTQPKPWALSSTIPLLPCTLFCPHNSQNTPTFHPYCVATVQALIVSQLDCRDNFPNDLCLLQFILQTFRSADMFITQNQQSTSLETFSGFPLLSQWKTNCLGRHKIHSFHIGIWLFRYFERKFRMYTLRRVHSWGIPLLWGWEFKKKKKTNGSTCNTLPCFLPGNLFYFSLFKAEFRFYFSQEALSDFIYLC